MLSMIIDYKNFVINQPSEETSLLSIYLFNVTNAADVFERGYKPNVKEVGPFGFNKYTYKYDVNFDTDSEDTVAYKEYNILTGIIDVLPESMPSHRFSDCLSLSLHLIDIDHNIIIEVGYFAI